MGIGKLTAGIIAGCFILFACIGCSNDPASQSPTVPVHAPEISPGHKLLGIYEFQIDSEAFSVEVLPKRTTLAHYNVTPFLIDPYMCPQLNCLQVGIISIDPVTNIHTVNVILRNPMNLTGHDIRGIVFLHPYHEHELVNFDAYTTVFGSGQFNPFIAFAKDEDNREFVPQAVHSAEYELWIPEQPQPYAINYAVDASWPENCMEPYDITEQEQVGGLFDEYGSECLIRCTVEDWQDPLDMDSVVVDAELITGPAILMTYNSLFHKWECVITNKMTPPPGEYLLPVTAKAADCAEQTKDFITITVQEAGTGDNTVTGTVEAYMDGGPMPGIFCFTTDGENVYSDFSDIDGHYELNHVPNGGRVISFTGVGTLAQFHEVYLTGSGAVVDAEMPCVFLYVDGPPYFELNPPEVNEPEMEAVISGTAEKLQDNNKVVFVIDGEEELHETFDGSNFNETIPLHSGLNLIRLRACNAKGLVFSDWIEIEI